MSPRQSAREIGQVAAPSVQSMGRNVVSLGVAAWVGCFVAAAAESFVWREVAAGVRSAELAVPAGGSTGFRLLPPARTGISFTNVLEERTGAANRVLYNGSGVAAGDFNGDGRPDLFFCSLSGANALYENRGDWRFANVTEQAGLKRDARYYRSAVFADVNGDRALDLLLGVIGGGVECWLNDGNGRFTDATVAARTSSSFAPATLALADVDGNGTLDLYVANNRTDDIRDRGQVNLQLVNGQMTVPPNLRHRLLMMNGQLYEYGEPDQLYLNDGRGRFTPLSWTGGRFRTEEGGPLTQPPLDWGLSATFRDLNDDGFPDLYVCNDFWTPDRVWLNDGKGRFQALPKLAMRNMCASSMGMDVADIDRDGDQDFFVVDMLSRDPQLRKRQKLAQPPMPSPIGAIDDRPQFMRNTLYLNRGDGTFAEIAHYAGVAASEWSWSPVFLDVDLDGYEDLLITAGHAKDVQDMDAAAQIRTRQHSWKGFASDAARQKAFTQELMEHMRLYPQLDMPIVAFRNRGDLRFEEVTDLWGTSAPGIHHGVALADFDGDGDLDFAVNNLGSAAGVYRNETSAFRVAVRLKGASPNTQAIGAKVKLWGGAVLLQTQEMVSGGRYLSGGEPLLTFAAGAGTNRMWIEIFWRSGKRSFVTNVTANRVYEIEESSGSSMWAEAKPPAPEPLFEDVSHRLRHGHHEEPFDDFARQPLLPWRLSQSGPGVSWFDVDGDGDDDVLVGTGRGGQPGLYVNDAGEFKPVEHGSLSAAVPRDQTTLLGWRTANGSVRLLVGSSSYENANTVGNGITSVDLTKKQVGDDFSGDKIDSAGPLAMADIDGDGNLDLFAGGRAIPGRYPEADPSLVFRSDGMRFQLDGGNSALLKNVGLVNGACWSDLDGDGLPELLLACEWGPLRIFRNEAGRLRSWDAPLSVGPETNSTFSRLTGLWTGITAGDFDSDGRPDIIAANYGLNSEYAASGERPLELHYGDLLDRGTVDVIETEWDQRLNALTPRRRLDVLARSLPPLLGSFRSHRAYSEASLEAVLAPFAPRVQKLTVTTLASMLFLNRGDRFEGVPLPVEAQLAPAFSVTVADFDGDGREDVFLSQNFFATVDEVPRLDAGRGLVLKGDGAGRFEPMPAARSGIQVYGEQRGAAVADFDGDGRTDLAVTQNGAATTLWRNVGARPGLRVRLSGTPGNRAGIGANVRLKSGTRAGPARELHAGSGYWSQDSAVQVLGFSKPPTAVWVRWPGGVVTTVNVPEGATEITVTNTMVR